jgi:UDP-glucuronate 4-epimerase
MKNKTVLVTGSAGFIGYHLVKKLCDMNFKVIGIDNINNYYSVKLKNDRLKILSKNKNFTFFKVDLVNKKKLDKVFKKYNFLKVYHLAAQAGVRKSLYEPDNYVQSNLVGFINILEYIKIKKIKKLIYASSSSVYGMDQKAPYKESAVLKQPMSLYAATKQSNEIIVQSYCRLHSIKAVGLRFFTAYGEYGRPDMAIHTITKRIIEKKNIYLVGRGGEVGRDFTFIDDIIDGTISASNFLDKSSNRGYFNEIFNLGSGKKTSILKLTKIIGNIVKLRPKIKFIKKNPTDMTLTHACIKKSKKFLKYYPKISLDHGLRNFCKWYSNYYNIN